MDEFKNQFAIKEFSKIEMATIFSQGMIEGIHLLADEIDLAPISESLLFSLLKTGYDKGLKCAEFMKEQRDMPCRRDRKICKGCWICTH